MVAIVVAFLVSLCILLIYCVYHFRLTFYYYYMHAYVPIKNGNLPLALCSYTSYSRPEAAGLLELLWILDLYEHKDNPFISLAFSLSLFACTGHKPINLILENIKQEWFTLFISMFSNWGYNTSRNCCSFNSCNEQLQNSTSLWIVLMKRLFQLVITGVRKTSNIICRPRTIIWRIYFVENIDKMQILRT